MMEKKVFSRIACLGLELTAEEWGEWIKQHSSSEVVFHHGDFGFNSHDVCLTPHSVMVYDAGGYRRWTIKVAQSPNGRWTEGSTTGWGSSPCMFCSDPTKGYATEREAIYAGLMRMEESARRDLAWYDRRHETGDQRINESKKVLAQIAVLKERYDPRQLTLF